VKVFTKGNNNGFIGDSSSLGFQANGNEIKIVVEDDDSDINAVSSDNGNIDSFKLNKYKSVLIQNYYGSVNISNTNKESMECFNGIIRRSENRVYSDLKEAIIVYIAYLLSVIFIIIFYKVSNIKNKEKNKFVQSKNGEWNYKCDLEHVDLVFNLIDVMVLLVIFIRKRKTIKNEGNDSQVYFKYKVLNKSNLTKENFLEIYKRSANLTSLASTVTSTIKG
ncbi:hypothetical protein PIROE2DRAFT_9461, partial [Piromyces sp. E2]